MCSSRHVVVALQGINDRIEVHLRRDENVNIAHWAHVIAFPLMNKGNESTAYPALFMCVLQPLRANAFYAQDRVGRVCVYFRTPI